MSTPITLYAMLFGWIPFVLVLFALMPPHRAAAVAVVGAWLVLPPVAIGIAGLPDISKSSVTTAGIMMGTLFFGLNYLSKFRPRWFDLPMLMWCFTGIATSVQNTLGFYDGLADAVTQALMWGLPYLCGRLYFSDPDGLRTFAVTIIGGGLCYVLPCLWESRMSPNLLQHIYGVSHWAGTRLGGYRPHVFFWTGLECGMWMTAASLTAWWLWKCGTTKKIGQVHFTGGVLSILIATTFLCRSTGALALLICGMTILWLSTRFKTRLILAGLLFAGPLYVAVRVPNLWSGQQAVDLAESIVGPDRAYSLKYRFMCEDLLIAKAMQQPILGWGGWGRADAFFNADTPYPAKVQTDGLWIIYLGGKGFAGLICIYLAMILPAGLFVWRFPARLWADPRVAPASVAAVLLTMYIIDCLLNGFVSLIYITLAGGLMGFDPKQFRLATRGSGGQTVEQSSVADQLALADHNYSLGRTLKAEGRLKEAETVWRQSLDLLSVLRTADPNSLDLQQRCCDCANDLVWLWANYNTDRHDLDTAVAMAQWIVEVCPSAAIYWNTLGVAHYRAGDDGSAITALNRATTLGGSMPFNEVFLAMAYARSGDRAQSEIRLDQAISQMRRDYPEHPELSRFCDEAHSLLTNGAGEPSAVR
jgi:tetratricopeptide (TPR) repeat protein